MTIRLHEDAQQEHEDAADYYNQECPGLGMNLRTKYTELLAGSKIIRKHGNHYQSALAVVWPIGFLMRLSISYAQNRFW
jgi:hypothetical protein